MPTDRELDELLAELVVQFLTRYYTVLTNKPQAWLDMIDTPNEENGCLTTFLKD